MRFLLLCLGCLQLTCELSCINNLREEFKKMREGSSDIFHLKKMIVLRMFLSTQKINEQVFHQEKFMIFDIVCRVNKTKNLLIFNLKSGMGGQWKIREISFFYFFNPLLSFSCKKSMSTAIPCNIPCFLSFDLSLLFSLNFPHLYIFHQWQINKIT